MEAHRILTGRASFDLAERVAIVTGVGGGIGRSLSLALADAGAHLVVIARSARDADTVAQEIAARGRRVLPLHADLSHASEAIAAVRTGAEHFGRLDVAVNVAGQQLRKAALDVTDEDWDQLLGINVKGTFFVCQEAARTMIDRGTGSIINITSLTSIIGLRELAVYSATRGGAVAQMTKALATEWAPFGVRVNAIAPGRLRTPMTEPLFADDSIRSSFERLIPQGHGGTADDLSGALIFLASDASSYMTGQTVIIDGGWLAGGGNPLG